MTENRQIVLAARPEGLPKASDFRLVESAHAGARRRAVPREDPLSFRRSVHARPDQRGQVATPSRWPRRRDGRRRGGDDRRVAAPDYRQGEVVVGYWGWQEYAVSDGQGVQRFDTSLAPMSTALGVLGMPGMTAYFGLLEIGQPKPGETVFVSGAAGAVGSLVGQIAKIKGCRVVGSAGSQEKVDLSLGELGFDAAFNYKEVKNYVAKLQEVCPNGIDVYFDNVGGPLTDAVFTRINVRARIVVCGQIDQYNATRPPRGPRLLWHLIVKRARAEGFLVFEFARRFARAGGRWPNGSRRGRSSTARRSSTAWRTPPRRSSACSTARTSASNWCGSLAISGAIRRDGVLHTARATRRADIPSRNSRVIDRRSIPGGGAATRP